jgi:hypothetical protein
MAHNHGVDAHHLKSDLNKIKEELFQTGPWAAARAIVDQQLMSDRTS